jgi:hypothetical protein
VRSQKFNKFFIIFSGPPGLGWEEEQKKQVQDILKGQAEH